MTLPVSDGLAWPHDEAERLRQKAASGDFARTSPHRLRTITAPALEYLRRAAPGSVFSSSAQEVMLDGTTGGSYALRKIADLLDDWVAFVEAGQASAVPPAAAARVQAATDLMEQVEILLADARMHPAAPVVLAGAALEELLRSMVIANEVEFNGKPGLNTYATALRSKGLLSQQEVKDITAWAGHRNEAAHGEFDDLSKQRARLMVDGINFFMQKRDVTSS